MTGGNHDGTVHLGVFKNNRHKHGRGGGKTAVKNPCPQIHSPLYCSFLQALSTQTGVMANGNLQLIGWLTDFLCQKINKGGANNIGNVMSKGDILAFNTFHGNTAYIAAILQLQQHFFVHIEHLQGIFFYI